MQGCGAEKLESREFYKHNNNGEYNQTIYSFYNRVNLWIILNSRIMTFVNSSWMTSHNGRNIRNVILGNSRFALISINGFRIEQQYINHRRINKKKYLLEKDYAQQRLPVFKDKEENEDRTRTGYVAPYCVQSVGAWVQVGLRGRARDLSDQHDRATDSAGIPSRARHHRQNNGF